MDAPAVLYALRWLVYDTFRQALSSRVFWIMLGLSALCIVFCLGIRIEGGTVQEDREIYLPSGEPLAGPNAQPGRMWLLFGFIEAPFARSANEAVQLVFSIFASRIAGIGGILMALVWTAGFIPEALSPSAAAVLLAKPVPRWLFLTGKYLGVVLFVALHAAIFFVGTWLAIGVRTGVWRVEYLAGAPLLTFHFATVYSFTLILAVVFRSTMACVVGGVTFWIICFGINYGRHAAVVWSELSGEPLPATTTFLADVGYWLLPKPADWTILLEQLLNLSANMSTLATSDPFKTAIASGQFHPSMSILTACLFAAFCLWTSAAHLAKTDY